MAGIVVRHAASVPGMPSRELVIRVVSVLGVTLGYYALALVGTVVSVQPSGFAIIWPATAFMTGALLLTKMRWWWAYLLGVVPAHFHMVANFQPTPVQPWIAAAQIGCNTSLAAVSALAVLRTNRGPLRFDSLRNVSAFILVAGVATTAVVSALILGAFSVAGRVHDFGLSWRQWMLANIFPTITITPLMVLIATGEALAARLRAEIVAVCGVLLVLTFLAFGGRPGNEFLPTQLLTPLPFMLWAALRWGVGGTSLALLLFAGAIIAQALAGVGPFAAHASIVSVLSLQVYLTVITVPLILLAALTQERRRDAERLKRSEARIEVAAASTDTGLWQWDVADRRLWMTEHCRAMFGLRREAAPTPDIFLDTVHPDDRQQVRALLDDALEGRDTGSIGEFRVLRADEERWLMMRARAETNAAGKPVRVSGVFRDVTQRMAAQQQSERLSQRLLTLQDDERKNIAEALHDTTTQHLVGIGLVVGMLERRVPLTEETQALIDDIRSEVLEASNELRTFTYLLRPPELERQGLCTVLRNYVHGFGLRTGLQTRSRLSPDANQLPIEQQRALLRIAQEGLANVYRHAAATRVSLDLRRNMGELHLVIRDNGRGLAAAFERSDSEPVRLGVGIPGMAARIRQLGGKIDVRSSPKGTAVHVALSISEGGGWGGRADAAAGA
jgi:PAS domain S-box-containing protein